MEREAEQSRGLGRAGEGWGGLEDDPSRSSAIFLSVSVASATRLTIIDVVILDCCSVMIDGV